MARALVIGAAGLLGGEVARALSSAGAEVVRTSRETVPGWIRFDAEGGAAVTKQLLDDAWPLELVVNCGGVLASEIDPAGPPTLRRAEAVNARFPHELARAAADRQIRVVHVSTDAVFPAESGRCFEDDDRFAGDPYASTKRRGEPSGENAISLRCSFVGRDPRRHRGVLEWLLAQPGGAEVAGYVDQAWNGVASTQVAAVCASLLDSDRFDRARREGAVHHLFEDPAISKYDLVADLARIFGLDVTVVPAESGRPSTRILGTRHAVLRESLESAAPRAASLEAMAAKHSG